jgi:hypothetical protein
MFALNSRRVPIRFPLCPQVPNVVPNIFSIAPHFYPICFGRCSSPFTYIGGPKGWNSILQTGTFYFGESLKFLFFWVAGQWNWLCGQKKSWTSEASHLIIKRGLSLSVTIRFQFKAKVYPQISQRCKVSFAECWQMVKLYHKLMSSSRKTFILKSYTDKRRPPKGKRRGKKY